MEHEYVPDFSIVRQVLSGRWTLAVLNALNQPLRFGELQTMLGSIARGTLSNELESLGQLGLVDRTSYPVFPPKVEYQLTQRGESLVEILSPLCL